MKTTKIIAALLGLILLTSAAFAGGTQEPLPSAAPEISIGLLPDVDSIPFVIADLKGYFEDEGISVTLQQFKNPVDRDTAFQAGETDAVISDLLSAALSINGGLKVRAVSQTNGSYKLLTAPGSPADTIVALKGMRLGISKNTIIEYATDKMLRTAGLTDADIRKEIIPQIPLRLEMLQSGKIDGATLAEPLATISVTAGCSVLISTDKLGINPGIVLIGQDFMAENRDAVTAMYRAYNRAVEYLAERDREDYIDGIIEAMGFPPAARDVMELPAYTKAQAPPAEEAAEVVSWLYGRGLIEKEFSYKELVDSSCLP
ncbi:MAG: ABC transporter substrate-binding protein [Spirochaetales bacterium]|nr:ABC transporter substrate-binding protein [Spirochaetales bacterium]